MDLTWDSLNAANATLNRWREKFSDSSGELNSEQVAVEVAQIALDFNLDLDTPRAIQKLRKIEKSDEFSPATKQAIAYKADELFGLKLDRPPTAKKELPAELVELLNDRADARSKKDFAKSDQLRDQLLASGIEVRDTAMGQEWDWV